jgi:Chaperone of endosialidase
MRLSSFCFAIALSLSLPAVGNDVPASTWRYQGSLNERGLPYDGMIGLRVTPFSSASGGKALAAAVSFPNVFVEKGHFGLDLELPTSLAEPWLQVEVFAADGSTTVLPTRTKLAKTLGAACWALNGNSGTNAASDFIGTTDAKRLSLRANGFNFLSGEFRTFVSGQTVLRAAPVVIGGSGGNSVAANVVGATIGGGGGVAPAVVDNTVRDDWGTIGGGGSNVAGSATASTTDATYATVGGGSANVASGGGSVIGGGFSNLSSGIGAAIGGGVGNQASDQVATVGGGFNNVASGENATIGGGIANVAAGVAATVPGGRSNQANAIDSFAAGESARVRPTDSNTFVWSDGTLFTSAQPNQFLVRASNGVGINTNQTTLGGLNVGNPNNSGAVVSLGWLDDVARIRVGGTGTGSVGGFEVQSISDQVLLRAVDVGSTARVGIGRSPTTYALEVQGEAFKTAGGSAWLTPSDARVKTEIEPLTGALDRLAALQPVSFRYTPDYLAAHPGTVDRRQVSVIAQAFAQIYPDAVRQSDEAVPGASSDAQKLLLVDLHPAMVDALSAVAELNAKNMQLERQLAALSDRLLQLDARINQLNRSGK